MVPRLIILLYNLKLKLSVLNIFYIKFHAGTSNAFLWKFKNLSNILSSNDTRHICEQRGKYFN